MIHVTVALIACVIIFYLDEYWLLCLHRLIPEQKIAENNFLNIKSL